MKYSRAQELEAGLRELADFIRDHGVELPCDLTFSSAYNFLYDSDGMTARQKARKTAKVLAKGGKAEKKFDGNYLELTRKFGPIKVEINVAREVVCEKRVVDRIEHPERVLKAYTEEVVEWDCIDPLLKAS